MSTTVQAPPSALVERIVLEAQIKHLSHQAADIFVCIQSDPHMSYERNAFLSRQLDSVLHARRELEWILAKT